MPLPDLFLGDTALQYVDHTAYVGLVFQSTASDIFAAHYSSKATKARQCAHAILGMNTLVGSLPPKEGRTLYMARVDPHLISAIKMAEQVLKPLEISSSSTK